MSLSIQEPHRLDSNVTINVPARILVEYKYPDGWYIQIDDKIVGEMVDGGGDYLGDLNGRVLKPTYFKDVGDATDWLVERDLLKTTAYTELDKKVKKVAKKKGK